MSRRFRRGVAALTLLASLTLAVGVWAKLRAEKMDTIALQLSETGQGAIKVFKAYAEGVKGSVSSGSCASLAEHVTPPVTGKAWTTREISQQDGVRVLSWQSDASLTLAGYKQLESVLAGLEALEKCTMKLAQVEHIADDGSAVARGVLWLRGRDSKNATVETQLHLRVPIAKQASHWDIAGEIELIKGRTVVGEVQGFADVGATAGLDFQAHLNPDWKTSEWFPHTYQIVKFAQGGIAAADFDGDGWEDLFFGDGLRSRLFRNSGDGRFVDVTVAAGLPDDLGAVSFGLFADLDNDGDQDLLIGGATIENRLFRNDDGLFTDVTEGAGIGGYFTTVAAAADTDNDGLLDLYVGRYLDPRTELPTTLFYTRNSEGNSLLRNKGGLQFEDVTEHAGVREGGLTLGAAFADYDRDGDQDLYVANDFGRNALLRNDGDGRFTDISAQSDAIDYGFGMSASWGDVDGDGDLDLYTSNVHSGQRWYGQAATLKQYLLTSLDEGTLFEDLSLYREVFDVLGDDWQGFGDRMVKGNSLLINTEGNFKDHGESTEANPFGWYWSSAFLDFDHDGDLDIYATNGWISGKKHDDL
ncbi:MAG: VCBS repeat-containing protein [bacterium]|nr:VCBS repeat-containing protein [bacterium]